MTGHALGNDGLLEPDGSVTVYQARHNRTERAQLLLHGGGGDFCRGVLLGGI